MRTYTLGEIHRLKLLKNQDGKAYRHKATIRAVVLQHLKYKRGKSKWGDTILVSEAEISRFNKRHVR